MTRRPSRPGDPARDLSSFLGTALTALLLAACWNAVAVSASGMVAIAELLAEPERYDKTVIAVVGHVAGLNDTTDRKGQPVYAFLLTEGNTSVKVVGYGRAPVHNGQYVMVEGTFRRLRQVRRTVVGHRIKVSLIRPLDHLHPDLVG